MLFNSLPNGKLLDKSKLKGFAEDKTNVAEKFKFILQRIKNIMRKEKNAGYRRFLLFPQWFQKDFYPGSLKVGIVW